MPAALKNHIIGLCGFAGAGKDTVADLLTTHAGFRKMAFADALRGEISAGFNVDLTQFGRSVSKQAPVAELALARGPLEFAAMVLASMVNDGTFDPRETTFAAFLAEPRSYRDVLQWWGTEYRRAQDPDYWCKRLSSTLHAHWQNGERHFVICDVRFANEVNTLRSYMGWLWQVSRPGVDAGGNEHVSATDGSQFEPHARIDNSGDIRHLQQQVLGEFWALDAGLEHVEVRIS